MSSIYICTGSSMHPYNCDGPPGCVHCAGKYIRGRHVPSRCAFCECMRSGCEGRHHRRGVTELQCDKCGMFCCRGPRAYPGRVHRTTWGDEPCGGHLRAYQQLKSPRSLEREEA